MDTNKIKENKQVLNRNHRGERIHIGNEGGCESESVVIVCLRRWKTRVWWRRCISSGIFISSSPAWWWCSPSKVFQLLSSSLYVTELLLFYFPYLLMVVVACVDNILVVVLMNENGNGIENLKMEVLVL